MISDPVSERQSEIIGKEQHAGDGDGGQEENEEGDHQRRSAQPGGPASSLKAPVQHLFLSFAPGSTPQTPPQDGQPDDKGDDIEDAALHVVEVHLGKDEDAVGKGFPVTVLDLHLHHGEGIIQKVHQDTRPDGIGDHEQHAQDDADDKGIEKLSGILMEQPEH